MAKKRRMFDIEMPDPSDGAETFPAGKVSDDKPRRGPMAAAITESAVSAREREEIAAQIRAENDALAHEHVRLRKLGLVLELVPLDAIDTEKLIRDRSPGADLELKELCNSIREIGLSNPVRLERKGDRFELIQGWRRLSAYRALRDETGDAEAWGDIPAAVTEPGEDISALYRRMVDENLVRKDISFAEMARLALDFAADPAVPVSDPEKAVATLFSSTGYQKRSYVRTFIKLVDKLDKDLRYMEEIPRALGLSLVQALDAEPGVADRIRSDLSGWDNRSVQDELDVLRKWVGQGGDAAPAKATKPAKPSPRGRSKTSFQFERPGGAVKCTAADGRLELRVGRDFSAVDRARLEQAVARLLDDLA